MQTFDWLDYSSLSDTENLTLNLSEKEKAFLLALLVYGQEQSRWDDITDSEWDTIEAWLANLDLKLLELS